MAFAAVWAFVVGILGLVIAALWGLTEHVTSYGNENLFAVNPLWLLLAVAVAASLWSGPRTRQVTIALAVVCGGLSVAGFVLQILPGLDQVNGAVYAMFLPPNVATAGGMVWTAGRARRAEP